MKLRARLLVMALLSAIPATMLVFTVNESLRARDMRLALGRFVTSQLTDDTRERCESNPNWFLAGPRPDRPSPQQLAAPDADVIAPRAQNAAKLARDGPRSTAWLFPDQDVGKRAVDAPQQRVADAREPPE